MADKAPDYEADLAEARRRIVEEAEARTGFLDLTELDLPVVPEELFELTHLRRLHLGWKLEETEDGEWRPAHFHGRWFVVENIDSLARLTPALEALSLFGTSGADISFLNRAINLRWLSVAVALVNDLTPLAGLDALQNLDCSETQVADLSPLAGLKALQTLDC
ncbi:MAG: hypothetical protein LDL44_02415, partial [Caenispirillum sp.]|nr:hypothetical protein [Caenispirillum sp.]